SVELVLERVLGLLRGRADLAHRGRERLEHGGARGRDVPGLAVLARFLGSGGVRVPADEPLLARDARVEPRHDRRGDLRDALLVVRELAHDGVLVPEPSLLVGELADARLRLVGLTPYDLQLAHRVP